jgi:hypothetical protein
MWEPIRGRRESHGLIRSRIETERDKLVYEVLAGFKLIRN